MTEEKSLVERKKGLKEKLVLSYVKWKIRTSIGRDHTYTFYQIAIAGTLLTVVGFTAEQLYLVGLMVMAAWYLIGWFDEKRMGARQNENIYSSKELNPFIARIENIEKKIDELLEKKNGQI